MTAAERWAEELDGWRIPDHILAQAPEDPWVFPPSLFVAEGVPEGALHRVAREALGPTGGSLLDVGCGGGGASVPLAPATVRLVGVDSSVDMLTGFAAAAERAGVEHTEVLGRWPDVAPRAGPADVVVCRNVVYNVATIEPFVRCLTESAYRTVVVELSESHPSVQLVPLWQHFWGLRRPSGPTAELFVAVVEQLGYPVTIERESRPSVKARIDPDQHAAFVRRRLCLDESRDPEIAAVLAEGGPIIADTVTAVTVAWEGRAR